MAEITYTCAICGYDYDTQEAFQQHMLTTHTRKTEIKEEGEEK